MRQIHIIVCVKQVPDPEGPAESFKIDPGGKEIIPVGLPPVINPFDENALEAALCIKGTHPANRITVISMGQKLSQPVLRKSLAAGADDLILLVDQKFKLLDSPSTAYVLSNAIKIIGAYDLILTGRQAGDWDFGITGLLIAEMLQLPSINLAQKVEIKNEAVFVERLTRYGYELVKAPVPVVVTVSGEVGELRYISVRSLQAVSGKPIKVYNAEDLQLDPQKLITRKIIELSAFHAQRECKFIEGESFQQRGENLALTLRKDKII